MCQVDANLVAAGFGSSDFDAVVAADKFDAIKPAPDIFLAAARLMGTPPEQCVVVEDAAAGVQAAKNAGRLSLGACSATWWRVTGSSSECIRRSEYGPNWLCFMTQHVHVIGISVANQLGCFQSCKRLKLPIFQSCLPLQCSVQKLHCDLPVFLDCTSCIERSQALLFVCCSALCDSHRILLMPCCYHLVACCM